MAAAFAALRIDQTETPGGGTAAAVRRAPPGTKFDLAQEAVQQMIARYAFAANARMAKAAGAMQKALLDFKA